MRDSPIDKRGTTPRWQRSPSGSRTRISPSARSKDPPDCSSICCAATGATGCGTKVRTIISSRCADCSRARSGLVKPAWMSLPSPSSPSGSRRRSWHLRAPRCRISRSRRARIRGSAYRLRNRRISSCGRSGSRCSGNGKAETGNETSKAGSARSTSPSHPCRSCSSHISTTHRSHASRFPFPVARCRGGHCFSCLPSCQPTPRLPLGLR